MAGRSKSKRSKQKILNAFEIAERQENGSASENEYNSDDNDDLNVQNGILDASKFFSEGQTKDLDDEEIDSDEALGSDDDYDILSSKFSQTIGDKAKKQKENDKRRRKGEVVSEEEEDEDEGYHSVDESQFVGLSEAWDLDDQDLQKSKGFGKSQDVVLDDEWASDSGSDSDPDSDSDSDSESEDDEEEDKEDNEEEIFGGFSDDDIDLTNTVSNLKSLLKKVPKEKRKLITETINENEFSIPSNGNVLSLNDMMAGIEGSDGADAILLDKDDKPKALDTPLPRNIQKKHERKAAYEITRDEVSKWEETVQQNRQAEVLKFPLNPTVKHNDTATTFRSENVPTTELEKKIHNVLTESSLVDDKKEATFEDLAVAKMSPEELKKRTNELRLMRELMFREETRARRIKKIKSKSFRKIKKKERLREQSLVEGSDLDDSDIEENERKRAEERMSLKHKTQSKWAKSIIKSGLTKDASNREELEEMLRQGEKLRAKQLGYNEGDQSDNDASDIEQEYNDDDDLGEENNIRSTVGKGVLAMDFMKAADERQKQANLQELEQLRKLEHGDDIKDFSGENSISSVINQGRRIYTPTAAAIKDDIAKMNKKVIQDIKDDEASNLVNKLSKNKQEQDDSKEASNDQKDSSDNANPWLLADSSKKSSKVKVVDKGSTKQDKTLNKMKKKSKSNNLGADLDIEVGETLGLETHEAEEEVFSQQDLIKEAFAGDNVTVEFEREKKRVIKDEDDKEEDLTLPGWGDWAGGKKKNKKRKIVRKIDGVVQKDKRRDKNLKNVIINEKVNKKNLKYQSSDVPYPYESREQYERALRMPVGQEWTSRETHQKLTMPRVITKQGTVIDPLKAPFK